MHLTITFPAGHDDMAIAERAAEQGLWLWPLSGSYVTRNIRNGLILGYGNVAGQAIPGAVEKLRAAMSGV
jgi:GntR family transcriptional regulator / MocR family aminotransferase